MEEIKQALAPLTDSLPQGAREFLDSGGWWLVLGVLAVVVLLLAWALVDRVLRALFGRATLDADNDRELNENLAAYPPLSQPAGVRRLMVYHLPARLRLAVLAPVGTEVPMEADAAEKLLDRLVPGLAAIAASDHARIRLWPAQLSHQGFALAFHRRTQCPELEGESSHWVLISGRAQIGRQTVMVGLGLWTNEPTTMGRLTLEAHQWLDVLRMKVPEG
jgi:hypothetical protein